MSSRVREFREARGLRREDVASRAGVSYETVRKLEADMHTPGLEMARRIAAALDATVDELWPSEPTEAPAPSGEAA